MANTSRDALPSLRLATVNIDCSDAGAMAEFYGRLPLPILKTTRVAPYQRLPTIYYPEAINSPRFMTTRSATSLSVLSKL